MQSKNWTELHPEHLKLILEAMNLYDNSSLKKQIIIEILKELNNITIFLFGDIQI